MNEGFYIYFNVVKYFCYIELKFDWILASMDLQAWIVNPWELLL